MVTVSSLTALQVVVMKTCLATSDAKVGIMKTHFQWFVIKIVEWVSWWRHQMETFSALLALCAGNSPVPGEFPAQRPMTRSFDVFFDLQLSKQSWGWWFEMPSCSLWFQCNGVAEGLANIWDVCPVFCRLLWYFNTFRPEEICWQFGDIWNTFAWVLHFD